MASPLVTWRQASRRAESLNKTNLHSKYEPSNQILLVNARNKRVRSASAREPAWTQLRLPGWEMIPGKSCACSIVHRRVFENCDKKKQLTERRGPVTESKVPSIQRLRK